ncbi:hypothetical protein [Aeropyrum pernix]|uniref:hypothetical protein n=1 Tax=Aeropyrum pernix TaxID=56636 RepID=UPI001305238F|nr:hypothetical protein [Aeropyrum pernix]
MYRRGLYNVLRRLGLVEEIDIEQRDLVVLDKTLADLTDDEFEQFLEGLKQVLAKQE